jgi:hypothetical protein
MRFLRHDGIYCSDVSCRLKNLGRSAASGRVRPRFRERAGSKRALPIVAMSSGRLFLSGLLASIARLRFTDDSQLIGVASANGSIYHRTVTCLLTVCLIERGNPRSCFASDRLYPLLKALDYGKVVTSDIC